MANGLLRLIGLILTTLVILSGAVVAVVSRTTPAQVREIVDAKQEVVKTRLFDACAKLDKVSQRQQELVEQIIVLKAGQVQIGEKLDRLLKK